MFKVGDKVTPVSLGGASYKDAKLNIENNIAIVSPSFQSYLVTTQHLYHTFDGL